MKITRMLLALTSLSAVCVSLAVAQPVTPRVDRREARQHSRIQQGVKSGELTPGEAMKLRAGQQDVKRVVPDGKDDDVDRRQRPRKVELRRSLPASSLRFRHVRTL